MSLPATTLAAIQILRDTLDRLEKGEIEVSMFHVGIFHEASDIYMPVQRTIELRTFTPLRKSDC